MFGRLRPSVGAGAAEGELNRLFGQLSAEHPTDYDHPSARVRPLADVFLGPVRPVLLVVWAGVGLLLVAACVNVANLLLMRASERGREVAIRAALGVTRGRLLRQLLTEACLLGGAGGLAALLPAWAAIRLVTVAGPPQLPRLADASLDVRAFAVACALSLASAVVFGLVPLRQFRRYDATAGRPSAPGGPNRLPCGGCGPHWPGATWASPRCCSSAPACWSARCSASCPSRPGSTPGRC